MNCAYSIQGYFQCKENFENPYLCTNDIQNLSIGYKGGKNCGDVCTAYAQTTFCPYFARNPISTITPCECGVQYKKVSFEKDPFSVALIREGGSITYNGNRLIGGESAKQYLDTSWNACRANYYQKTLGDGMWISYKNAENINHNIPKNLDVPGTCTIHYNRH